MNWKRQFDSVPAHCDSVTCPLLTVEEVLTEEMEVCLAAPRGGAAAPRRDKLLMLEMELIPDIPLML